MSAGGLSKEEASLQTGYGSDRDYGVGAQILHELGLRRILLLSNHPPRVSALEGFELEIVGNVPLGAPTRDERGARAAKTSGPDVAPA
jgi:3,4-dihydroxy 2-butanone 4-phosphate synthase/GTP cyclohydrolase II